MITSFIQTLHSYVYPYLWYNSPNFPIITSNGQVCSIRILSKVFNSPVQMLPWSDQEEFAERPITVYQLMNFLNKFNLSVGQFHLSYRTYNKQLSQIYDQFKLAWTHLDTSDTLEANIEKIKNLHKSQTDILKNFSKLVKCHRKHINSFCATVNYARSKINSSLVSDLFSLKNYQSTSNLQKISQLYKSSMQSLKMFDQIVSTYRTKIDDFYAKIKEMRQTIYEWFMLQVFIQLQLRGYKLFNVTTELINRCAQISSASISNRPKWRYVSIYIDQLRQEIKNLIIESKNVSQNIVKFNAMFKTYTMQFSRSKCSDYIMQVYLIIHVIKQVLNGLSEISVTLRTEYTNICSKFSTKKPLRLWTLKSYAKTSDL